MQKTDRKLLQPIKGGMRLSNCRPGFRHLLVDFAKANVLIASKKNVKKLMVGFSVRYQAFSSWHELCIYRLEIDKPGVEANGCFFPLQR